MRKLMPQLAKAAIFTEPGKPMVIDSIELDDPQPKEILVRVIASGVCHTDFGVQHMLPKPMILGHEGSGIVEKIGKNISTVSVGDKVVLTFGSCGVCPCCKENNHAYCDKLRDYQFSGKRIDGSSTIYKSNYVNLYSSFFQQSSFATYALATERNVIKIEEPEAPLKMLGPLGCGIQTGAGAILNSMKVDKNSDLVVFGTGSVGLSAIMAGKIVGCKKLIAVDTNTQRLKLAEKLGATHIINPEKRNTVDYIKSITEQRGANFSFETSGSEISFNNSIECLANLGTAGFVTTPMHGKTIPFNPAPILLGGKKLMGIIMGSSIPEKFIPKLTKLFLNGQFPIDKLITYYQFTDINKAIEDSKKGIVIKPILLMEE